MVLIVLCLHHDLAYSHGTPWLCNAITYDQYRMSSMFWYSRSVVVRVLSELINHVLGLLTLSVERMSRGNSRGFPHTLSLSSCYCTFSFGLCF